MSTIKSITSYLVMTVLALLMSVCAMAQDVESAFAKFDKQTNVAAANLFFSELLKAEFVDEETVFPDPTGHLPTRSRSRYGTGLASGCTTSSSMSGLRRMR